MHKELLVASFPRSGTHYIRDVLHSFGLKVGHETEGPYGAVSCFHVVDDYYYPGLHKTRLRDTFYRHRFHQVRHPLKAIGSFRKLQKAFVFNWFEKHTGIGLDDGTKAEVVAQLWLEWNRKIESQRVDLFYRIEDLGEVWPEFQKRLGIEGPIPDHIGHNQQRFDDATWEELGIWEDDVREMAKRYGYTL